MLKLSSFVCQEGALPWAKVDRAKQVLQNYTCWVLKEQNVPVEYYRLVNNCSTDGHSDGVGILCVVMSEEVTLGRANSKANSKEVDDLFSS